MKKGFALGLTLLLLLILAILGFSLLLIAGSYYSSSHNLFESQNARLTCETAVKQMVDLYNQNPGVVQFSKFQFNGYVITPELKATWNPSASNTVEIEAQKGSFIAKEQVLLRQRRLEDFALYTDGEQTFAGSSLYDGLLYCGGSLQIGSLVRFRDFVQCDVAPDWNASYRKKTMQTFPYAIVDSYTVPVSGISISNHNSLFWATDHYELNLDLLTFSLSRGTWTVNYRSQFVGKSKTLMLRFDAKVLLRQTDFEIPYLPSGNAIVPLYISAPEISIATNLPGFQDHPLCLISSGVIQITHEVPSGCRIHAMLIAQGSVPINGRDVSIIIESGANAGSFPISEVTHSSFLVEPERKADLLQAIAAGQRIIWFRGSVISQSGIDAPLEITQMHFENSHDVFGLLPSLPFIYIVEGSKTWL